VVRAAEVSGNGSNGRPEQSHHYSHRTTDQSLEFNGLVLGQVFELSRHAHQTFDFRCGSHRDPEMPPKLTRGAESVTFNDIGFNGYSGSANLIEQRSRAGMIGRVGYAKDEHCQSMCSLPGDHGLILVHRSDTNKESR